MTGEIEQRERRHPPEQVRTKQLRAHLSTKNNLQFMGCDIHAYIETTPTTAKTDKPAWVNFAREFRLDRNYGMFGFLAGVRIPHTPIVPLRGRPTDAAFLTDLDAHLFIDDKSADQDGFCSQENAERYEIDLNCKIE